MSTIPKEAIEAAQAALVAGAPYAIDGEEMILPAGVVENMLASAAPFMLPQGWKLVPVEPTPEMIAAWPYYKHGAGHEASIWRAMISASPEAPK